MAAVHGVFRRAVLVGGAAVLAACGSGDADVATATSTEPTEILETETTAPVTSTTDAPEADLAGWAEEVQDALVAYWRADGGPPVGTTPVELVEQQVEFLRDQLGETVAAMPPPPGVDDIDVAYDSFLASFDDVSAAVTGIADTVAVDRDGLAQVLEVSGAQFPFYEGTQLEEPYRALADASVAIGDRCFDLAEVLDGRVDLVLDCVGSSLAIPEEAVTEAAGMAFEAAGVTVTMAEDSTYGVELLANGVEFVGVDGCVWIGRPSGVTDPDGDYTSPIVQEFGEDEILLAERAVPTSLEAMAEWVVGLEPVDLGTVSPTDVDASPFPGFVDGHYRDDGAFPIYYLASEPQFEKGCNQLGWGQSVRLRVIDDPGGPIMMVTTTHPLDGAMDPTSGSAALDATEDGIFEQFGLRY